MFTYDKDDTILKKIITISMWVIGGIILAAIFGLLVGLLVQYLWNWLMPMLFGLKAITFWQAFGIVVLAKILFGSFDEGHRKDDHHKKRQDSHCGPGHLNRKDRKHYERFWKEKGKKAFEEYLEKVESDGEKKDDDS